MSTVECTGKDCPICAMLDDLIPPLPKEGSVIRCAFYSPTKGQCLLPQYHEAERRHDFDPTRPSSKYVDESESL